MKQVWFALQPCYLGWVMIAATDQGICTIALGDRADTLEREVREDFPNAVSSTDDPIFVAWVKYVMNAIESPHQPLPDLPLDIQGTAFQQQVWNVLREIPVGSTMSYQEVAARIGNEQAVRAVAQACAANKFAVVIPCHRVIRSDETLGGYRGGVERKRMLLEYERQLPDHISQ